MCVYAVNSEPCGNYLDLINLLYFYSTSIYTNLYECKQKIENVLKMTVNSFKQT